MSPQYQIQSHPSQEEFTVRFTAWEQISAQDKAEMAALNFCEWVADPALERAKMWDSGKCPVLARVFGGSELIAACAVWVEQLATPFAHQKLPVMYSEFHLEAPDLWERDLPDPFEFLAHCALAEFCGPTWKLRNVIYISLSMNPFRIEKYLRHSNKAFPRSKDMLESMRAAAFAREVIQEKMGYEWIFPEDFVAAMPGPIQDITEEWNTRFADHSPAAEDLLRQHLVIQTLGNRILLQPRRLLMVAVHTPAQELDYVMNRF